MDLARAGSVLLLTVVLAVLPSGLGALEPLRAVPGSEQAVEAGKKVYRERCWFCHGEKGDGNGPVAEYLDPKPRDFTLGTYKLRSTGSGELPTDSDLFRTITRGISGTAMPEWGSYLSEQERRDVVQYLKTFAPEFANPDLDPAQKVVEISKEVSSSHQSIEKGREVFKKAKCFECHGMQGRGDGQKSADMKDDWGFPLRIRNLTKGWTLKGGTEPRDIFLRFTTGINGTPMPSFVKTLSEEDRWHLANYVSKEIVRNPHFDKVVLEALRVSGGDVPRDPEDPRWEKAQALDIPLAGQVLAAPRWQNHAVEMVTLRAVYNDREIAFLVAWDDPYQDTVHQEELELKGAGDSFAKPFSKILPRKPGNFRDALALQFPVRLSEGLEKPHFFRGEPGKPVHLWHWQSDRQAQGQEPVSVRVAKGFRQPWSASPPEVRKIQGKGQWKDGQWRVVFTRALVTENRRGEIQFEPGKLIPLAVEAWEGSNGEHGLLLSLSTWHYLYLKESTPVRVYVFALLGVALVATGEFWLWRRLRRKGETPRGG